MTSGLMILLHSELENGPVEIVDLPIENGDVPYIYIYTYIYTYWLVVGILTPLKNMKVSWDDEILNLMGKIFSHVPVTTNQCSMEIYSERYTAHMAHVRAAM